MITPIRAGLLSRPGAFLSGRYGPLRLPTSPTSARDIDDAAIKLEAQIKSDAGSPGKPAAALAPRRGCCVPEERFPHRHDGARPGRRRRTGRRGRAGCGSRDTVLQIKPRDAQERALLLDRATSSAYIAYQRASDRALEADSLAVVGRSLADRKEWRPALDALRLSLDLREAADLRGQYERLRVRARLPLLGLHRRLRLPFHRAPVSSSPKNCRAAVPTSRLSLPSPAWTARRSRPTTSSFASKASSTASAILLRCAPACRRWCARRWPNRPSSRSRARPQAFRALLGQGLRAAARRPARHSAAQRQHRRHHAVALSHRRPQSDRHRAGL